MANTMIGVIGGSGLYEIDGLQNAAWQTIETPWGPPSDAILTGTLGGVPMAFLPRHGRGHVHTPSSVPYRANIDALKRLGVTDVISVSACGSFREEMAPGGTLLFCASERNARGRGYRVEKRFMKPTPHDRSLFVTADGDVLEQRRTLPITEAPKPVLATALKCGSFVERVEIVSATSGDEHWQVLVRDRGGKHFTVTIELNGQRRGLRRRLVGRIDS